MWTIFRLLNGPKSCLAFALKTLAPKCWSATSFSKKDIVTDCMRATCPAVPTWYSEAKEKSSSFMDVFGIATADAPWRECRSLVSISGSQSSKQTNSGTRAINGVFFARGGAC